MEEKDRLFIEALFAKQAEQFQQLLDQRLAETEQRLVQHFEQRLDERLAETEQRLVQYFEQRLDQRLAEMEQRFAEHVSKISEDFDGKIAKLAEGHQAVIERLDRIEAALEALAARVDKLELMLIAHMSDVDAHHGVYRVREAALEYAAEIERDKAARRGTKPFPAAGADEDFVTE